MDIGEEEKRTYEFEPVQEPAPTPEEAPTPAPDRELEPVGS